MIGDERPERILFCGGVFNRGIGNGYLSFHCGGIMTDQKEYAKCLCPSCYVLGCENRKKSAVIGGVNKEETHFENLDSF